MQLRQRLPRTKFASAWCRHVAAQYRWHPLQQESYLQMSQTTPNPPHDGHISLMRPEDVRYWTKLLAISFESLRRIVAEVGTDLSTVNSVLDKRRSARSDQG